MKVVLAVAVSALLTAACGAYSFPAAPTQSPSTGTVGGHVLIFPCAPVEQQNAVCAGRPAAGLQLIFESGSSKVTTTTDTRGDYSIRLAPGTWKVSFGTYMRVITGPTSVAVSAGSSVVADYLLDSGIRAPVPQA